jgi:hypothetical protein
MGRVEVGHAGRWEYFRVMQGRYGKAEGKAKGVMLDEFCLNTGYHRKYAIRLLNGRAAESRWSHCNWMILLAVRRRGPQRREKRYWSFRLGVQSAGISRG